MDLGLAGKVVIVTGGGSNIGRGIVLAFAREGAKIANAEIDVAQGQKVVEEARELGAEAELIRTDVTTWESVQAMVDQTLKRFGQIDVLVNNAGGTQSQHFFIDKSREEWEHEVKLNYWSVINCTRAVLPHMMQRKTGRIVNITSGSGQIGMGAIGHVVYGGLKGGVMALSKGLSWEIGRHGITVNCVSPGWIVPHSREHTGEGSFWNQWGYDHYTPAKLEMAMKSWPIPRLGRPEDIAHSVLFFAAEQASFLTGQTMSVSGGLVGW
jgi:2-hydroxycyclohexanecarboxyl-CoA dehydrogenase